MKNKNDDYKPKKNLNTMLDDQLLSFVEELTALAERIVDRLRYQGKGKKYKKGDELKKIGDDVYFIFRFLNRTTNYGESITLLTKNEFFHGAIIIARTVLEGLIYFEAGLNNPGLYTKWRRFSICEDLQKGVKISTIQMLNDYKEKFGPEVVEQAVEEFECDDTSKAIAWHKHGGGIPVLIKEITKDKKRMDCGKEEQIQKKLLTLYKKLYQPFSQIIHWTPTGVIGGDLDINAALAVTFQSLFVMSKCANAKYVNETHKTEFNDELNDICDRYVQTLYPRISRKK